MNWAVLSLVVLFMSITANVFLVWMLRTKFTGNDPLLDELRGANEVLRNENKGLYHQITTMAASVPHIRLVKDEEEKVESENTLHEFDDENNIIGHKGAGVV